MEGFDLTLYKDGDLCRRNLRLSTIYHNFDVASLDTHTLIIFVFKNTILALVFKPCVGFKPCVCNVYFVHIISFGHKRMDAKIKLYTHGWLLSHYRLGTIVDFGDVWRNVCERRDSGVTFPYKFIEWQKVTAKMSLVHALFYKRLKCVYRTVMSGDVHKAKMRWTMCQQL